MLNAAIVGLGWWGRLMVDSVHWSSEKLQFTHGVVRTLEKSRAFADKRQISLHTSLDDVLNLPSVDAVVLATPHSVHVEQVIACAKAGKPVFCEKPIGLTLEEATQAISACENAGVVFGLGTDRRLLPAMLRLKTMVDGGELGDLIHLEGQYSNNNMAAGVSGDWRTDPRETPGAGMTGPGLHILDALINIAGPVASLSGQVIHPQGLETPIDAASLLLSFEAGQTGLLGCVRGVPNYFRLAVFGTNGWAEMRGFGDLHIHLHDRHPWSERYDDTLAVGPLLEAFGSAVIGEKPFPVSNTSVLQTVAAFEAAIKTLSGDGPQKVTFVEERTAL